MKVIMKVILRSQNQINAIIISNIDKIKMSAEIIQTLMNYSPMDEEYRFVYTISSQPVVNDSQVNQECIEFINELIYPQKEKSIVGDFFSEPIYKNQPLSKKTIEEDYIKQKEENTNKDQEGVIEQKEVQGQILYANQQSQQVQNSSSRSENSKKKLPKKTLKSKKSRKILKPQRDEYPTKNFLPTFRSPILCYLSKQFQNKSQFQSIQIIKTIRGKPCINIFDYQNLFNQKKFRPYLKIYFDNKMIVRDLMQTRINYERKRKYFKRIHVFQEAFNSGVFEKIN